MSERVRLAEQSLEDEPSAASVTAVLTRFGGTPFYIAPEVGVEAHHQLVVQLSVPCCACP